MSSAVLSQRKALSDKLSRQGYDGSKGKGGSLETQIADLRDELKALREEFMERDAKGTKLIDAYKSVLSEMADLIESEREVNVKREESLRFFMSSTESRLKSDIRAELGLEGDDADAPANSWWPFGRFR